MQVGHGGQRSSIYLSGSPAPTHTLALLLLTAVTLGRSASAVKAVHTHTPLVRADLYASVVHYIYIYIYYVCCLQGQFAVCKDSSAVAAGHLAVGQPRQPHPAVVGFIDVSEHQHKQTSCVVSLFENFIRITYMVVMPLDSLG